MKRFTVESSVPPEFQALINDPNTQAALAGFILDRLPVRDRAETGLAGLHDAIKQHRNTQLREIFDTLSLEREGNLIKASFSDRLLVSFEQWQYFYSSIGVGLNISKSFQGALGQGAHGEILIHPEEHKPEEVSQALNKNGLSQYANHKAELLNTLLILFLKEHLSDFRCESLESELLRYFENSPGDSPHNVIMQCGNSSHCVYIHRDIIAEPHIIEIRTEEVDSEASRRRFSGKLVKA